VIALALIFHVVLGRLPISRSVQLGLLFAACLAYVQVVGLQTSVIRACFMVIVVRSAYLVRRDPDLLSALALAGLVLLAFDPHSIESVGFQLTMVAVGAFALFGRAPGTGRLWIVRASFRATLVSTLAVAPILLQRGLPIALESFLTAPVAAIGIPWLVAASIIAFFIGYWALPIGGFLLKAMAGPILFGLKFLSQLSAAPLHASMPSFSGYWLVLYYGAALLIWRPRHALT
jgi:competence protein ComEC